MPTAAAHCKTCPYDEQIVALAQKKSGPDWSTLASVAGVIIILLGFLWSMAGRLATIEANQVSAAHNIDLILGALNLKPSISAGPTSVSARRE